MHLSRGVGAQQTGRLRLLASPTLFSKVLTYGDKIKESERNISIRSLDRYLSLQITRRESPLQNEYPKPPP